MDPTGSMIHDVVSPMASAKLLMGLFVFIFFKSSGQKKVYLVRLGSKTGTY